MMGQWYDRRSTRLKEYDYNTPGAYFLTICVENRKCILSRIVGTGILDSPKVELLPYGKIAAKYINQLNDFYEHLAVDSYVIMPNHIHILLRVLEGPSGPLVPTVQNSVVSRFVSTFKRFCNKEYGRNIWQARSYVHVIRDQADYDKHLQYIYENPFGWEKDELFTGESQC
jgi:REP element-mobilizing transposase RayT